jgi:DNA primase small subunit
MTDYDSIRTCCSGTDICRRCWAFISAAVRVLDSAIRDQFGYQHLLWVYSGRRGIHLWVSDKEAMELTDDQRKAVVGWLTVLQGGKEMHKKVNVRVGSYPLPPPIACVQVSLLLSFTRPRYYADRLWRSSEKYLGILYSRTRIVSLPMKVGRPYFTCSLMDPL